MLQGAKKEGCGVKEYEVFLQELLQIEDHFYFVPFYTIILVKQYC